MGIESAGAGIRTQKGFPPGDFKSPAVADFATPTNTPYCNDLRLRTLGASNALGDDPGDKQVSGKVQYISILPSLHALAEGHDLRLAVLDHDAPHVRLGKVLRGALLPERGPPGPLGFERHLIFEVIQWKEDGRVPPSQ